MSDSGGVSEPVHSGGESVEPVWPRISDWMVRALAQTEKIMSKLTVHDPEPNLEVYELTDDELNVVGGGGKQKSDGTAAGNVAAKWSLAQGAAA
jgi:hypothetical protein